MAKAKKPLIFELKVKVELKPDGQSYVYEIKGDGTESFVCPEHAGSLEAIRGCVLDNVLMLLQEYALEDDDKLAPDAIELKNRLLKMASVTEADRGGMK